MSTNHTDCGGDLEVRSSSTTTLTAISNDNEDDDNDTIPTTTTTITNMTIRNQYPTGILVLLTVPLAWGTYTPVIQYISTKIELPVPGLFFSAAYYIVAAVTLWTTTILVTNNTTLRTKSLPIRSTSPKKYNDVVEYWYGGMELGLYLFVANVLQIMGLQNYSVPADRAGFLIQLTTLFVPLLEAFLIAGTISPSFRSQNDDDVIHPSSIPKSTTHIIPTSNPITNNIQPQTWMACGLALIGVLVFDINFDEIITSSSSRSSSILPTTTTISDLFQNICIVLSNTVKHIGTGDYLILSAAVLYSLHVVRLGRYAKVCDALPLAASKATVEAILSIGLVATLVTFDTNRLHQVLPTTTIMNGLMKYMAETGQEMNTFMTSISTLVVSNGVVDTVTNMIPTITAILWTGWVTCAYTIFAQSYGQSRVPPTQANLIYSVQPLCTAFFAYALLGETLSPSGFVGAAFIGAAVYIVAVADDKGSAE